MSKTLQATESAQRRVTPTRRRPRERQLNLPLLTGSLVFAVLVAVGGYFWHARQLERLAVAFLERADRLEEEKNWTKAADYLYLYLQIHRDDRDVLIRTARTVDRAARRRSEKGSAVHWYYRALGFAPDRVDLRCRVAELLLELDRPVAAREETEQILDGDPENKVALQVRALALHALSRSTGVVPVDEAISALEHANRVSPDCVPVAQSLADMYRNQLLELSQDERQQRADHVLRRLVKATPGSAQAYFARYQHRSKYGRDGARADLLRAYQLAPRNTNILVAVAEDVRARKGIAATAPLYRRLIEIRPRDSRGYLGLGDFHVVRREFDQAAEVYRRGLEANNPEHIKLNLKLAAALIKASRLDEAHAVLETLEQVTDTLATRYAEAERATLVVSTELLRAKWLLAQGKRLPAIPVLKSVVMTARNAEDRNEDAGIALQAWLLLGQVYSGLHRWEEAGAAFDQAVLLKPNQFQSRLAAAQAWAAAGQFDKASRRCEQVLALDRAGAAVWLHLARLEFQVQWRTPPAARDWQRLEKILARCDETSPGNWQLGLLRASVAVTRAGEDGLGSVLEILWAAEDAHSNVPEFWHSLALFYERLGMVEEANRAVRRVAETTGDHLAAELLQVEIAVRRADFSRAAERLRVARSRAVPADARRLNLAALRLQQRSGNSGQYYEALAKLSESYPADMEVFRRLAEAALDKSDVSAGQQWEEKLRDLEGTDGTHWRFYRSRRLLALSESTGDARFQAARQLLGEIEQQRPSWSRACWLRGCLTEQEGNLGEAIQLYSQAVARGIEQTTVYQRLIRLLIAAGRLQDADEYLVWLQQGSSPLDDVWLPAALPGQDGDRLERVVDLARELTVADPHNASAWLRYAESLAAAGRSDEAESTFERATGLAPEDTGIWMRRLAHAARTGQREILETTIRSLDENADLPRHLRHFVRARGCEFLGRREQAIEHYRMAESLDAEHVATKLQLARLLHRAQPDEAVKLLRNVLQLAPSHKGAREALALLSDLRSEQDDSQVERLLLRASGSLGILPDVRTQAMLLVRRGGAENLQRARELLEDLVQGTRHVWSRDRVLLAQLYEQAGDVELARDQLKRVVEQASSSAEQVEAYVGFLLRHNHLDEASVWLEKLRQQHPGSIDTVRLYSHWLKAVGRADEIEEMVEPFAESRLETLQQDSEIEKLYLAVAQVYSSAQQHEAAERWYRGLGQRLPDRYAPLADYLLREGRPLEAVSVCVTAAQESKSPEAHVLLATVMLGVESDPELDTMVDAVLADAVDRHAEHADLLFAISNLRLKQLRIEEAAALLRRVTSLRPYHLLAWNNLAAVLAAEPQRRDEALRCVEHAIGQAGSDAPTLLDTKGFLLTLQGRLDEAIGLLQQAIASPRGNDARFHFHLGLALHRRGALQEARRALQRARELEISRKYLTPFEQKLYAQLEQDLALSQTSLHR